MLDQVAGLHLDVENFARSLRLDLNRRVGVDRARRLRGDGDIATRDRHGLIDGRRWSLAARADESKQEQLGGGRIFTSTTSAVTRVACHLAIAQDDLPVRVRGDVRFMGDENDGLTIGSAAS